MRFFSLAARCTKSFSSAVRTRGQSYFYSRAVKCVEQDQDGARFAVQGSEFEPYDVEISFQPTAKSQLRTSCTCPYAFSGEPCKHIWAALLACEQLGLAKNVPGAEILRVVVSDDDVDDSDDNFDSEDADSFDELPRKKRVAASQPWLKQFTKLKASLSTTDSLPASRRIVADVGREAWFVLDIAATVRFGQPVIVFYERSLKKDGTFAKIKKVGIDRNEIERFANSEDRQLLEILVGVDRIALDHATSQYGYSYQSLYQSKRNLGTVLPNSVSTLLPRLCETQRFVAVLDTTSRPEIESAAPLSWDAGAPWTPRIRILHDAAANSLRVVGELRRDEESMSIAKPSLMLNTGLMINGESLGLWEVSGVFEWVVWLRDAGEIVVPEKDQDQFLSHLWTLPRLPTIEFPDTLQWEQVRLEPKPLVRITRPKKQTYARAGHELLHVALFFQYGDQTVAATAPEAAIVDSEHRRVLVRDIALEQQMRDQLLSVGVTFEYDYYYSRRELRVMESKFGKVMEQLIDFGWTVEAEGKIIRRPGEMKLSVSSNVDWFELSAEIDFEGVSASLPALLAAMRNGEKFVQLGDGTSGVLPKEWLEKFGRLADLGNSDAKDDVIKFAPTQALLLDALLAAQEADTVTVDRQFASFRKKLKEFSGVAAANAPKTFRGELRHYQEEGLGWLNFLRDFGFGGCLADDMGLGKTIQVLAMLESRRTRRLKADETRRPSLVVVPRSLVFNWMEEAKKFTPNLRVLNYSEKDRSLIRENLSDYDVVLTTYGILRLDIPHLTETRFDYAILDESQAIKNSASQAAKACRLIQADHRLAMTGTPVENHLGELWSLFDFLNPGMLGRSGTFQTLARAAVAQPAAPAPSDKAQARTIVNGETLEDHEATDEDRQQSLSVLASALRPFILRRTKKQVLTELPERTEQTLYCEMEPKQRKQYDELRDFYRQSLTQTVAKKGLAKSKIHVLEALLRLRQAACHPGLLDKKKIKEPSAKLDTLLEQIEELAAENHKALVFSQFTSLLDIVRQRLDERKLTYEYLDGKTRDRQARVDRFQNDPACPLFLISLKAGGHGLNLTAADYVFILDPWWNPAVEAQAIDRAYRMGQTRNVFAYRLICKGTVEDKILELQKSKKELADAIVSADNSLIRSLTADDLQMLLS